MNIESHGTRLLGAAILVLGLASPAMAHDSETPAKKAKAAFGPFDGGSARPVFRQGQKGKDRKAHPMVGHVAKIPAEGAVPADLRRDPDMPEINLQAANRVGNRLASNPLYLYALVYRHFLTKMDGARCHHYPTCSRFASQAVAKHGLLGIPLGLDRLLQTGQSSVLRWHPEIDVLGSRRFYDPVSNYEFWKKENFAAFPKPTPEEPLELPGEGVTFSSEKKKQ